ncbi:amidase family protein [Streptomyces coffeae]|uniref:Amidase domain-containing protein n=1 Tax=Streptomyces coffeae TaxID=621382 RepID=A0ABS1NCI8_9ACTN|nr:amidase family protein [Streptomyces coffeae]MBL1097674.1 hypothetical protein [Streptomyces coffeae]
MDLREFLGGYARRGMLRHKVSVFMSKFPLLLLPNSGEAPFPLGDDVASVDRTRQIMARQWPNMAVPVLGLPGLGIGVHRNGGAPIGVQIVGRAFHEDMALAAGEVIEARSQIRTPIDPSTDVG